MLPLDSLIHRLESAGFRVSPADRLRVVQLLDAMGSECLENPNKLRLLLAPILARSAAEQAKFYEVFDQWMPAPISSDDSKSSDEYSKRTRRRWFIVTGLIILAVFAAWYFTHPEPAPTPPKEEITQNAAPDSTNTAENPTDLPQEKPTEQEILKPQLPIKELLLAKEQETPRPSWLAWSILALLTLATGWMWWKWAKRAAPKTAEPTRSPVTAPNGAALGEIADAPPYTIPFRGQEAYIRTGREQYRLADAMRQRQQGEHPYMDVPASVQATLDKGGFPTLRFRLRRQPADYLCVIDEKHRQSHLTRLFKFFAEHIRGQDVALEIFQASSTLDRFWNAQFPGGLTLDQLQRLFPAHRLLLFGDAHALLDVAASGQARIRPDMSAAFRRWRQRVLFTPNAPSTWTFEEKALYELFALFPATLQGMNDAAHHIEASVGVSADDEAPPSFAHWRERAQQRAAYPQHDHRYTRWRDAADHEEYLAGRPDLLLWLQALAVYPTPTWEITLAIGQSLEKQGVTVRPDDLLILSRIGWLQTGRMPSALREELMADLPPEAETAARHAVINALEEARTEAGNGFAGIELGVNVAVQEFALAPEDPEKQEAMRLLFEAGRVNKTQEQVADVALARHVMRRKAPGGGKTSEALASARDFVRKEPDLIEEGVGQSEYENWKPISQTQKNCLYSASIGTAFLTLLIVLQMIGGRLETILVSVWLWLLFATLPVQLVLWGSFLVKGKSDKILNPFAHRLLAWCTWIYFILVFVTFLAEPFALEYISLQEYLFQSMNWILPNELYLIGLYVLVFYAKDFLKIDIKNSSLKRSFFTKNLWMALGLTLLIVEFLVFIIVYMKWCDVGEAREKKEERSWIQHNLFQWQVQADSATIWNNRGVRVWNEQKDTAGADLLFKMASGPFGIDKAMFETEELPGSLTAWVNRYKLPYKLATEYLNGQFAQLTLPPEDLRRYRESPKKYFGPGYSSAEMDSAISSLKPLTESLVLPLKNDALHALGLAQLYRFRRDSAEACYEQLIKRDSAYFINLHSPRPNLETLLGKLTNRIVSIEANTDAKGRLRATVYFQLKEPPAWSLVLTAELFDKAGKVLARASMPQPKSGKGLNQFTFLLPTDTKTAAFVTDSLRVQVLTKGRETKVLAEWKEARRFEWKSDVVMPVNDPHRSEKPRLTLYFDNNQPDPPSSKTTTNLAYQSTFASFMRKKDEYKAAYVKGLSGTAKLMALDSMEYFFENEVRESWNDFFEFNDELFNMFEQGDTIRISLKGYFSENKSIEDGQALASRRVSSVVNHFKTFDGGIFDKFLFNGQLIITERPPSQSKSQVNLGVYDLDAARNRKVEIFFTKTAKATAATPNGGGKTNTAAIDTDADGIPDTEDKCPNEKGNLVNGGCPPPNIPISEGKQPLVVKKNIVFFGSSLTSAYQLSPEEGFTALIQRKIDSLNLPYTCVNAGLSDETTADGVNRIEWVLQQPVDIFVLEMGVNDALRGLPITKSKKNLQIILDKVKSKYPSCKIVIAGLLAPPNLSNTYTNAFRDMYPALAKKNRATLIPILLKDINGVPELNLPDGIHPNKEGHKIMAENVWKELKNIL